MASKQNALAVCLFEAIDDQNLSNIIVLLEKHGADPNFIIQKLQIAPLHYAIGFDNLEFAEKITAIFLKKKADSNLFSETDGLRPLHIACMWGREKIVKLLLDNGADLDLKCNDNQTPINYAIHENHFNVIETIQKFIFEKKIEKKRKELILTSKNVANPEESYSTPIKNNHLKNAIQNLEEKKFTPNRINYNFDVTSPYYIGITHRRHKTSRENREIENKPEPSSEKNLFELTKRNLEEFSQQMSQVIVIDRLAIHKRRSYIRNWREKIQQIRKTDSGLDVDYINYLNSCNNVTLMNNQTSSSVEEENSSSESYTTAKSDLQRLENAIRVTPEFTEVIQENYIHSDTESGVVLYERRIITKSRENLRAIEESDDDARSLSSVSTKVTLPPLDYDTDALRNELRNFGENPGPITKNTKRLYLKQLVKIKRQPEIVQSRKKVQISFSQELQKTISNFGFLEQSLPDFLKLEAQMTRHFHERQHIKWREGNIKSSFIYLLIDPRASENLPEQYKNMQKSEVWSRFLSSIFYVGKGKKSRPYSHLYDAMKLYSMENNQIAERLENKKNQIIEKRVLYSNAGNKTEALSGKPKIISKTINSQESKKLQKIVDIWKSQLGVVCLHIFNNIIPVEAFTREAAIIDAMGVDSLTNLKRGDFYGVARNFSMRQKRQMGVGLIFRAMNIYLHEGESQLTPFDLI